LVDALLKEMQPEVSELTFTNLFVWRESEPAQLSRLDETVLIQRRRQRDGRLRLMPPLGKQPLLDVLEALKDAAREHQPLPPLYGLTGAQALELSSRGVRAESSRDDWDYVYLTGELADLPGDRYHPKRNLIAQCLSRHECEYVRVKPSVIAECLQLQAEWCSLRNCDLVPGLAAENRAIKQLFKHYEALGVFGGAIYVDGRLQAFTVAEPLNDETAVIHFEKANPEIKGLYQLINQRFCQRALRGFRFVNREQDLGVPALRKAKLGYYPHHMVEKHIAYLA